MIYPMCLSSQSKGKRAPTAKETPVQESPIVTPVVAPVVVPKPSPKPEDPSTLSRGNEGSSASRGWRGGRGHWRGTRANYRGGRGGYAPIMPTFRIPKVNWLVKWCVHNGPWYTQSNCDNNICTGLKHVSIGYVKITEGEEFCWYVWRSQSPLGPFPRCRNGPQRNRSSCIY